MILPLVDLNQIAVLLEIKLLVPVYQISLEEFLTVDQNAL